VSATSMKKLSCAFARMGGTPRDAWNPEHQLSDRDDPLHRDQQSLTGL
jgi:hypothetical protein